MHSLKIFCLGKPNLKIIRIVGVPRSYLITAPPSAFVPDVIGALSVWIQTPNKKRRECDVIGAQTIQLVDFKPPKKETGICVRF